MLKLGLGTVQWGTDYGIANMSGMTDPNVVADILRLAVEWGVNILDTAPSYGLAEDLLGSQGVAVQGFNIITKTLSIKGLVKDGNIAGRLIRDRFFVSLSKLAVSSVYGLLVHNAADLLGPCGDSIWKVLIALRKDGHVQKIGCSYYHPAELEMLIARYDMDIIQIPLNIYDKRFLYSGYLENAKKRGIEVHARSVFLQGLLLMSEVQLPRYFESIRPHHAKFIATCRNERISPLVASLGFVIKSGMIDKVIVGCESVSQCLDILTAAYSSNIITIDWDKFEYLELRNEAFINPTNWPKHG